MVLVSASLDEQIPLDKCFSCMLASTEWCLGHEGREITCRRQFSGDESDEEIIPNRLELLEQLSGEDHIILCLWFRLSDMENPGWNCAASSFP